MKDNGGPAFPDIKECTSRYPRDYFAAKAMQGLIANIDSLEIYFNESSISTREEMTEKVSEISFDFADAMIKERDK